MKKLTAIALALVLIAGANPPAPEEAPEPTFDTFTASAPPVPFIPNVVIGYAPEVKDIPQGHETAHRVWERLREEYSAVISAGIMGNLMAEVGGGTLRLRWDVYGENGNYYGMCQWNKWGFPEVQGQGEEFQIDFLLSTIEGEMGKGYDRLLQSETPEEATVAFAMYYERCAKWSYGPRKRYARKAYEYFGGGYNA